LIVLKPTRLHWIQDEGDDPTDLCAYSPVVFSVGSTQLVLPEEGDWTVSAASLFLLRTLRRDHTPDHLVSAQLFPCCGMDYHLAGTEPETVIIPHCPAGVNCWVRHSEGGVHVWREADRVEVVKASAWRAAALAFAGEVRAFYRQSLPKQPFDANSALEYSAFVAEWDRLEGTG
jgi:hypothetical protein